MFKTLEEFDAACRQFQIDWNASGRTSCTGCPQAMVDYSFWYEGFRDHGDTFDCIRSGKGGYTITGAIERWPEHAPWIGPAKNLKIHYTPEELLANKDRYITDWSEVGEPDPNKLERVTAIRDIEKQAKSVYAPLTLPDMGDAFERWFEPVAWKAGPNNTTVWKAKHDCNLTGEIAIDYSESGIAVYTSDYAVLCVVDDLDEAWVKMGTVTEGEYIADGFAVSYVTHNVSLDLKEGNCVFLGSTSRSTDNFTVFGNIRLSVDNPVTDLDAPINKTGRRPFIWKAHADLLINEKEQFESPDGDINNADKSFPEVDHGLGGKPVPAWAVEATSNNWGAAYWVDNKPGKKTKFVDPDTDLAARINAAKREVMTVDAVEAWKRTSAGELRPVFGRVMGDILLSLNLHDDSNEKFNAFEFGAGETVWALPETLWREILALSLTDRQFYRDDYQTCGDFAMDLKADVAKKHLNGVHIVLDWSSGPETKFRTATTDNGHAYCALLCYEPDGALRYFFVEPQNDEEVSPDPRTPHYRGERGYVWLATSRQ